MQADGYIDETCSEDNYHMGGVRTELLNSYEWPRFFYSFSLTGLRKSRSAVARMREYGILFWYGTINPSRKKRKTVDVDALVQKWKPVISGLATAHDKDQADVYEASLDECLSPLLTAPVKQLREFARKLADAMKADPQIPYLVWHGYEIWIEKIVLTAKDEEVKELKTHLAREIAELVETDAKAQLTEAITRALQWRSPEKLEKVKEVVQQEKAAGRSVRLRGRESCLFLEAGGTETEPAVCIQI